MKIGGGAVFGVPRTAVYPGSRRFIFRCHTSSFVALGRRNEKPVEKSEFDKHVDELFKEMNMCLDFDEIGSTPLVRARPVGLSAAIRFKQLCRENDVDYSVCVVEKGAQLVSADFSKY
ncbi:hypothetical protein AgCh_020416 [Apium graveolens]